jgi:hypothetical protein
MRPRCIGNTHVASNSIAVVHVTAIRAQPRAHVPILPTAAAIDTSAMSLLGLRFFGYRRPSFEPGSGIELRALEGDAHAPEPTTRNMRPCYCTRSGRWCTTRLPGQLLKRGVVKFRQWLCVTVCALSISAPMTPYGHAAPADAAIERGDAAAMDVVGSDWAAGVLVSPATTLADVVGSDWAAGLVGSRSDGLIACTADAAPITAPSC